MAIGTGMAQWDGSGAILLPVALGMQRSSSWFLAIVVVLLAVAALLPALGGDEPSPPALPPSPVVPEPGPPAPDGPTAPPALPDDAWLVRVAATCVERYVPPPPPRAVAVWAVDGRELPTEVVAGAGAGFDAEPHQIGVALLRIGLDGHEVLRQVALERDVVVRPTVGGRLVVTGTVRDAQQRPLPGAEVWCGESDAAGAPVLATAGDDGSFRLEVHAGSGVPCVVRASGFAATWRALLVATPMVPLDVSLAPGASLDVQLAGLAVGMQGARAFVVPQAPVATELTQWPFFLQALRGGVPLDAAGRARIDGLPRAGSLGVLVVHPLAALAPPVPVVLKGERQALVVPIQFAAAVAQGIVVDADGAARSGVMAWTRAASQRLRSGNAQRLLPPHLDLVGAFAGRSGEDGSFTLGRPAALDAVLSLRAAGCAGRDVALATLAAGARLALPTWRGGEPQFTLAPPVAGTPWFAASNLGGGVLAGVASDQGFCQSVPHAGRYDFVLTTSVAGGVRATTTLPGLDITGPIELAPPR
jgi:hypothetical protein